MRGELIALDLETTGLDPQIDGIIEIGAVRFKEGEVLERFNTFVDPGMPLPERITALTGIHPEDLDGAPRIDYVLGDLRKFIGQLPILGHNVAFDLSFLRRYGVGKHNVLVDTYELAAVLLPTAPRYNLTSLSEQLGLQDLTQAHRALADAEAHARIYWALWEKLLTLPFEILDEIVEAARGMDWMCRDPFEEAHRQRVQSIGVEARRRRAEMAFKPLPERTRTLRPVSDPEMLDADKLGKNIEPGGKLEHFIEGYETRHSQVEMLKAVAKALNNGRHLMIEAPTGTGKSIAYLIPSIYWATNNSERVVISTATITLQDQLIKKDLPLLKQALGVNFEAVVLKGRANYLCPRRLMTLRRRPPTSVEELRVLAKILVWMLESDSGDRGEISLRGGDEENMWVRLSAQDEGCMLNRCEEQMEGACPFYKARRQADAAHILIVNHALLLSDVAVENRVLPDFRYLVIDEAHNLEEATTNGLSTELDRFTLQRRFADLAKVEKDGFGGLLGDLLKNVKDSIPPAHYQKLEDYVKNVVDAVKHMGALVDSYFRTLYGFLTQHVNISRSEYVTHIRLTEELRQKAEWAQVQYVWTTLKEFLKVISSAMDKIGDRLATSLIEYDIPNYEDLVSSVQTAVNHFQQIYQQMETFTVAPRENTIYWATVGQDGERGVSINTAPLHVGPLIEKHIWDAKKCVILTSATMSAASSFEFMRERLNATPDRVDELIVETPFDYKNAALIFIPTDIPEPTIKDQYEMAIERGIIELATALNGRLLGLFTSYSHLRKTSKNITPRLALGGIQVYDQTSGSSRQLLIDSFKLSEKAVLLGTRSFWEGIDLPGDDLQALAITRLPFSVPSDPIFAARSEKIDDSFLQFAVPEAVLLFRQGFGRLIRRKTDRGIVVIFDKRIISKRYGQHFLDSLPECTVFRGPLARLGEVAKRWINR